MTILRLCLAAAWLSLAYAGSCAIAQNASAPPAAQAAVGGCGSCLDAPSGCGDDDGDECGEPPWMVRVGSVILDRANPQSRTLITDAGSGQELANANQFDFDWNAGPDLALIGRLGSDTSLELRHFFVDQFSATQFYSMPGAFDLHTTPPVQAPFGADIDATYASSIYSTEINLRQQCAPCLIGLVGFRWIELRENLDFWATMPGQTAQFWTNAHNHLYGAQCGADVSVWDRGGPLRIGCLLKAGIFGNAASQNALDQVWDGGGGPLFSAGFEGRGADVAFVGEIGVTVVYRLTRAIALRGGYQLLWLDGVAAAGDQIAAIDLVGGSANVDTTGLVFYHGVLAGLEIRF